MKAPVRLHGWRQLGAVLMVGALAVGAFRWLAQVDYDTHPTADLPSQPTRVPENEADAALAAGVQWALDHAPASHALCKAELGEGLKALGCHRHVTAQKAVPPLPDWRRQPTTLACVSAVQAHYQPLLQDLHEMGDHHAAAVWWVRRYQPAVRECDNVDNLRIVQAVHEPLARLDALLARTLAGTALTDDELTQLRRDVPVVEGFRAHELRSRYLARAEALFGMLGGRSRVFPKARTGAQQDAQCARLAQALAAQRAAFQAAVAEGAHTSESGGRNDAQLVQATQQNRLLATWTQLADEQLKAGCPTFAAVGR